MARRRPTEIFSCPPPLHPLHPLHPLRPHVARSYGHRLGGVAWTRICREAKVERFSTLVRRIVPNEEERRRGVTSVRWAVATACSEVSRSGGEAMQSTRGRASSLSVTRDQSPCAERIMLERVTRAPMTPSGSFEIDAPSTLGSCSELP